MRFPISAMAREGIPFIILFLAPAAIFFALGWWVAGGGFLFLAAFMAFFFRDPERRTPSGDDIIVSPADGRVVMVGPVDEKVENPATQVSIFLSPLDVHINRSPMAGELTDVVYKPGAFHVASRPIASVENEQNVVTVRGPLVTIVFRQIAGLLARRVVFWKEKGDRVALGERVGLMKFSSRMDVVMPAEVEVLVQRGDRVTGGVTIIGRIRRPLERMKDEG
ncbi:MAG: phosphatidylserine decarboxylase family protein [Blastocatellia bacterium]|nr:phosphatidylserine decarboxylase family protein [Blastocatellia bacterium]